MIQTTIPAAVSFRRAATEGIPAHRLEYRLPTYRRSPTAFKVIKDLSIELFPEWRSKFEALNEERLSQNISLLSNRVALGRAAV